MLCIHRVQSIDSLVSYFDKVILKTKLIILAYTVLSKCNSNFEKICHEHNPIKNMYDVNILKV